MAATAKVCILNDTTEWYHWGCNGTSRGLRSLVDRNLKPAAVATVPINLTYAPSYLPDTLAAAKDARNALEFLKTWPAGHLLLDASDIVINAEGTIHSAFAHVARLLYLTYVSTHFLGKRVYLVNHSIFPPTGNASILELYRLAYRHAYYVAARESDSVAIAREAFGRDITLAFDCLPLTIATTTLLPPEDRPEYAIITGTSGMNQSNLAILKAGAEILAKRGLHLVWLLGAPKNPAADEHAQATKFAAEIGAEIVDATSFEAWVHWIRDARFMFSGRFHYVIARLCVGGPLASFGGNTPKIGALLRDRNLPELVIKSEEETAGTIAIADRTDMPPRVAALAEAASRNLPE